MNKRPVFSILISVLAIAAGLLACNLSSKSGNIEFHTTAVVTLSVSGQIGSPATPTPAETSASPTRGLGGFDLASPVAGLDKLPGYRSELKTAFKGTLSGKSYETSSTITREQMAGKGDRIMEVDYSATDEQPFYLLSGQIGDQQVSKTAKDAQCQTVAGAAAEDTGEVPDPASLLRPVAGAQLVGEESIGSISADHYKFDQAALGISQGTAAGEVWVAKDGGWVVKYTLDIQAPEGVLGVGMAGEQTWEYSAEAVDALELPEGCTPALDGYPLLDDAQDVMRMSGAISYTSAASLDQAAQFYREKMTAAGWTEQKAFTASADQNVLLFGKPGDSDQKLVSIGLRSGAAGLRVDIQEITTPLPPTPAPGAGQAPAIPTIPGLENLPIPLPTP